MILSNRVYDILKWIGQILLPAAGALYFGLSDIWNLPKGTEVVGTIAIIDTFLGVLVTVSHNTYKSSPERFDGSIDVVQTEDTKLYSLKLDSDPQNLDEKNEVLFKVNKDEHPPVA